MLLFSVEGLRLIKSLSVLNQDALKCRQHCAIPAKWTVIQFASSASPFVCQQIFIQDGLTRCLLRHQLPEPQARKPTRHPLVLLVCRKDSWWQWRLVHEEPSRCLFVWQRAPGALRQIQHGLRAVLDLSRQQHPVLLLQPLDNLEVSIPTSNVDGQPARLGRGHQRHPVLLRQPLDQCPSPRAQCMGCEPSLALAVSDTP